MLYCKNNYNWIWIVLLKWWFSTRGDFSLWETFDSVQRHFCLWSVCCAALSHSVCPILWDPMDCNPPVSSVHGDSPGKNTAVGCHALLQGIFPTQGSNPGLPHCRRILYHLSHEGSCVETRDVAKHSMRHRIVPPWQRILWVRILCGPGCDWETLLRDAV